MPGDLASFAVWRIVAVVEAAESLIPQWTLAERLQKALDVSGITDEEMAHHLGVTDRTIRNYCSGHTTPRAGQIRQWAARTNVSLRWLAQDHIDLTDAELAGDGIHSSLGMVYQPSLPFDADDPAAGDLIGAGMGLETHYAEVDLRDERVSVAPLVHAAA